VSCVVCQQPVGPEDKEFSEDQERHPGILGEVHKSCYGKEVDARPDLPWTDPISGEVDFETMSDDLGVATESDFEDVDY